MKFKYAQTPSQTVGPYFAYCLTPEQYGYDYKSIANNHLLKTDDLEEEQIIITGKVFDANLVPVSDAMIELFQDNSLQGFGRMGTGTENDNRFIFHTTKPKQGDGQAPFINIVLMMRGLLNHLFTRIYFSDEQLANKNDDLLNAVPQVRKQTLIAQRRAKNGVVFYDFDIYMQGDKETVFFDA